ncbi:MAG: type IV pilus modification protein PilV [Pseudomonadota bacterium]
MKPTTLCLSRRVRGVTLIEVLVALVIVAVGLLGLAGLQVRGLSIQKDAHGRAIATQLALDLADRMRANRVPGALTPPVEYAFTAAYPTGTPTLPAASADCEAGVCNEAQQAQFDRARWLTRVTQALPGGWAHVEPIGGTGNRAWNVTLLWSETGLRARGLLASSCNAAALPPAGLGYATPAEVECMRIVVRP